MQVTSGHTCPVLRFPSISCPPAPMIPLLRQRVSSSGQARPPLDPTLPSCLCLGSCGEDGSSEAPGTCSRGHDAEHRANGTRTAWAMPSGQHSCCWEALTMVAPTCSGVRGSQRSRLGRGASNQEERETQLVPILLYPLLVLQLHQAPEQGFFHNHKIMHSNCYNFITQMHLLTLLNRQCILGYATVYKVILHNTDTGW